MLLYELTQEQTHSDQGKLAENVNRQCQSNVRSCFVFGICFFVFFFAALAYIVSHFNLLFFFNYINETLKCGCYFYITFSIY